MYGKSGIRRGVVQFVGFVALAAVPVLVLNSLASASHSSASVSDTASTSITAGVPVARPAPPPLTPAQTQCLAEQGVTVPAKPAV